MRKPGGRGWGRAIASAGAPTGGSRRDELLDVEATLHRVRWIGAGFALLQFTLYQPSAGVDDPPFAPVPTGLGFASLVLLVDLVVRVLARGADEPRLIRIGIAGLVADSAIVLGIVWLFTFDPASALWALLVVPVLEGALRAELRGAMLTWAALAVGYVVRDVWASAHFDDRAFELDSVTYRLGIVLIVAVNAGGLARGLARQMTASQEARGESEHRAAMLRAVAAASRSMTSLDADELLEVIVESAVGIGFDASQIVVFDEGAGTWRTRCQRGLPGATGRSHPLDAGIPALVHQHRATVVVDGRTAWTDAEMPAADFGAIVGCPVWSDEELAAALVAGARDRTSLSPSEVEYLELLAAQAGVALTKARRFAEQRAYEEQLAHQALHDPLTGLANRALFMDRLTLALARARRRRSLVGVLFVDVDRFEIVNESLGHTVGDQLLVAIGERLATVLRPGDTVARFGSDQFTILCEELSADEGATTIAQQVADLMVTPFVVADREVHLTVSTGIAISHGDDVQPDAILRNADSAMARAKALGKARYELFDELLHTRAMGRLELENALHRALERHELRVWYQPEIDLATDHLVGAEALVRWHHPDRGIVLPTEFIALAEESSLIGQIGTWVLGEACRDMQAWQEAHAGHPPLRVSVNLSARQLTDPDIVAIVVEALQTSGLPPSQLCLEITESAVMDDAEHNVEVLRSLKALGLELAIDDFGTGYSSLSYLKRFPVDALKIDRSFVDGLGRDPEDTAIVSAVVSLGRSLGLDTVAEGVETAEQLAALRTLGCRFGQGFVWGEATPIEHLDPWQGHPRRRVSA